MMTIVMMVMMMMIVMMVMMMMMIIQFLSNIKSFYILVDKRWSTSLIYLQLFHS
jgi:hypothetical protein